MDFKELLAEATQLYIDNSSLRIGQALFNTLHANNPELADEIRGTVNDPFFAEKMDDIRVKNFLIFIEGALNGKGE